MIFCYGISLGPIPFTLTGELFPRHLSSTGCGITVAARFIASFVQLRLFHKVRDFGGMAGVYWSNGMTEVAACVFVYIVLPETRNLSVSRIENLFAKKDEKREEKALDKNIEIFTK